MIIKRYACGRFAGIKDKAIDFSENLNVLLGPNEAGKSTLVEGIFSVLFKPSRLDSRTTAGREFRDKYMPLPAGDSIDGTVALSTEAGVYELKKEWGASPGAELFLPDSQRIKDEAAIEEALREVLPFGEGTCRNVVFSRQADIKRAIGNLLEDREAAGEIGFLLRKAVMELDGISLEVLGERIEKELKDLTAKWDLEREAPQNNRRVTNPYKTGVGRILEHYYGKERLRLEIREAAEAEGRMEALLEETKEAEARVEALKQKRDALAALERDVQARLALEPELARQMEKTGGLMKASREWPQADMRLEQLEKEIEGVRKERTDLETERKKAARLFERELLEKSLSRLEVLEGERAGIEARLAEGARVTKEDLGTLEAFSRELETLKARMEAGTLIARVSRLEAGSRLVATADLQEPRILSLEAVLEAKGFLKLEMEGFGALEVKAGKLDFEEMRKRHGEAKTGLDRLLKALGLPNVPAAAAALEASTQGEQKLEALGGQIEELLDGKSPEDLRKALDAFGDLSGVRLPEEIEEEALALEEAFVKLSSERKVLQERVEAWREAYGDLEGLFAETVEVQSQKRAAEARLAQLAPLPEAYETAEAFLAALSGTREALERDRMLLGDLKKDYFELLAEMPEATCEELEKAFEEEEMRFNKSLERARKLVKVRSAFEAAKKEMDGASFKPMAESFSEHLSRLTGDAYRVQALDESLAPELVKDGQLVMPVDLLSSGTYDAVALAFRLAILESLLKDRRGMLVLDDCLVDMDPARKERAVALIRSFAEKHQVIFTTCDPETAAALGGNLIEMA